MIDEIWDRHYQAGRAQLHDGIGRAFKRLASSLEATFRAIHDIQFAAPWADDKRRRTDPGCA